MVCLVCSGGEWVAGDPTSLARDNILSLSASINLFLIIYHVTLATEFERLPGDTPAADMLLSTLLQMAIIDWMPTRCLIMAGYKALPGQPNYEDKSKQVVFYTYKLLNHLTAEPFTIFSRNSVYVSIAYSRSKANKIFHLHIMST